MAFMQPEFYTGRIAIVENKHGETYHVPAGYEDPQDDETVTFEEGTLARLQAPGYLDATDWTPYDNEEVANVELCEEHDLCPSCHEVLNEDYRCDTCDDAIEAR